MITRCIAITPPWSQEASERSPSHTTQEVISRQIRLQGTLTGQCEFEQPSIDSEL